ncbi:hypothetical protein BDN72DRAFT_859850 [Pluteus cervinus]|uniref:Uncharacterized protein n=1 Tax=Pluteus cervinus TaxID=181527 RepID=A0ACD3ALE6_9AGAR|nr:hypothetical protein BDN72DRAFT_859850 [Pluteus cervinus]
MVSDIIVRSSQRDSFLHESLRGSLTCIGRLRTSRATWKEKAGWRSCTARRYQTYRQLEPPLDAGMANMEDISGGQFMDLHDSDLTRQIAPSQSNLPKNPTFKPTLISSNYIKQCSMAAALRPYYQHHGFSILKKKGLAQREAGFSACFVEALDMQHSGNYKYTTINPPHLKV